jgi:D-amino peptidase
MEIKFMKIYISVDMEGFAGNISWNQEGKDREIVRNNMIEQVKWLIEGIKQSDLNKKITQITIVDSYANGENLLYSIIEEDDRIFLISGYPRDKYMMPQLNESYNHVFLAGYHAGTGVFNGNMDHTYSGSCVRKLEINGVRMSEALINAIYAVWQKSAVTLITGDEILKEELENQNLLKNYEFVSLKRGLGRFSAVNFPKNVIKKQTIDAVKKVLSKKFEIKKTTLSKDFIMKVELTNTTMADFVELIPCVKRTDGTNIEYKNADFSKIMDCIMAVTLLAAHGK